MFIDFQNNDQGIVTAINVLIIESEQIIGHKTPKKLNYKATNSFDSPPKATMPSNRQYYYFY